MTALAAILSNLDPTWKAFTTLASAVAVGAAVGALLMGFTGLPAEVEKNTQYRIQHTREFEALVCLLTLEEGTTREQAIGRCGI